MERLGLHTELKEMEIKNEETGQIEKRLVRMVTNPNPRVAEAYAMLMENPSEAIWRTIGRIPGLKALREEFDDVVANTAGGCTGCKRGALLQKYAPRVMVLLERYREQEATHRNEALEEYQRMTGGPAARPIPKSTQRVTTNNDAETVKDTGAERVSAPGTASTAGAPKRKTVLRRAAEGIAKIFRKSKAAG